MANHGDKMGRRRGRGDYGQGAFIRELPQHVIHRQSDFSGGYVAASSRTDTPKNASYDAQDIQVTPRGRLARLPGATTREVYADRTLHQMGLHPSLSFRSELIFFDPPFIGVKSDAATIWYDVGLEKSGQDFVWSTYGETFLFSNGSAVWTREPQASSVTKLDAAPVGVTMNTFAGRVFIGGASVEGNREPLAMAWNGTSGDLNDWTGDGSGFELLIDDMSLGDKIVANRSMGLNLMAILMRRSIWIGRFTGNANRPADFQPRVPGIGAVNEKCARASRFGVVFLSDTGVYIFDGNNVEMVSGQINGELLPLDPNRINEYSAVYSPITQQYKLLTPFGTWILDLANRRWYKSSIIAQAGVVFPKQGDASTWDEMVGNWDALNDVTWEDLSPPEAEAGNIFYLGNEDGASAVAEEDPFSDTFFGLPLTPYWTMPWLDGPQSTWIFTIDNIYVESKRSGKLRFYLPDREGLFVDVLAQTVGGDETLRTIAYPLIHSGKGVGMRLEIALGRMEISAIEVKAMPRGPRIEEVPFTVREYYPDFAQ